MNTCSSKVIVAKMIPKEHASWIPEQKHISNRLLRNTSFFAAGSLCLGLCAWLAANQPQKTEMVMSHLTAGFEYDETLGRLQLVSNLLPESAMVFLSTNESAMPFCNPSDGQIMHAWTQQEPWLVYSSAEEIAACQKGEIMTIVKNHAGTHTIRVLHENGYESIYSGLEDVYLQEHDAVQMGQVIAAGGESASFELRRDGISVLPVFSEI